MNVWIATTAVALFFAFWNSRFASISNDATFASFPLALPYINIVLLRGNYISNLNKKYRIIGVKKKVEKV